MDFGSGLLAMFIIMMIGAVITGVLALWTDAREADDFAILMFLVGIGLIFIGAGILTTFGPPSPHHHPVAVRRSIR